MGDGERRRTYKRSKDRPGEKGGWRTVAHRGIHHTRRDMNTNRNETMNVGLKIEIEADTQFKPKKKDSVFLLWEYMRLDELNTIISLSLLLHFLVEYIDRPLGLERGRRSIPDTALSPDLAYLFNVLLAQLYLLHVFHDAI